MNIKNIRDSIQIYRRRKTIFYMCSGRKRRIFPSQLVRDLIVVQPMSKPAGLLFYLDYTYGTDKNKKEKE